LYKQKQQAQVENSGRDELRNRMADMSAFPREQPTVIAEYDKRLDSEAN